MSQPELLGRHEGTPRAWLRRGKARRLPARETLAPEPDCATPGWGLSTGHQCSGSLVQRLRSDQIRGSTLGKDRQHWRRARFFQQCRLFFPFHVPSKKVVLAWVNDSSTRRAYRSRTDAYRVFQDMLDKGQPPDDWDQLLGERDVKACWPMILANSYAPWLPRLSRCSWR